MSTPGGPPLRGAFNFRDLEGLRLEDGRRIRHGRLFRSDTLQALTPEDVGYLVEACGIRAVVDLRLATEVHEEGRGPIAARTEVAFVHSPLEMASASGIAPGAVLDHLYARCLASPSLAQAVQAIARHADRPTLFHCAAGKDRTGIVAAIVLGLVGVSTEDIVSDYLRSRAAMPRMIERFRSWPRYRDHLTAMPPEVYDVEEGPIRRLMARIDDEFGGVRGWATDRGIPPALIGRLQSCLVEPAST